MMESHKTDDRSSFVIRPRPYPMESLNGFRIRVAEANRFGETRYLAEKNPGVAFELDHGARDYTSYLHSLEFLAGQLRLPASVLEKQWPCLPRATQHEAVVRIGKLELARADVRVEAVQICPACIEEDGFASWLWETRYYTVCHRHRCLMTTHCTSCGKLLSGIRGRLLNCFSCRSPISGSPIGSIRSGPALLLSEAIADAAHNGRLSPNELSAYAPLFSENLREGFRALRIMAAMIHGPKRPWLQNKTESAESRYAALTSLIALFEEWPSAWFENLDARVAAADFRADKGLRSLFRRELEKLDPETSQAPEFIRVAFTDWLLERFPAIGKVQAFQPLMKGVDDGQELIELAEAAEKLNVSYRKAHDWTKEGKLQSYRAEMGAYKRVYVYKYSVDELLAEQSGKVTLKQAAARLGISSRVAASLVEHRLLPEMKSDSRRARFISIESVEMLLQKVAEARRVKPQKSDMGVTAMLAMAGSRWPGLAGLLDAILNRGLPVSSFDENEGLRSIHVPEDMLKQHLREISLDESLRWMRVDEAAKYLEISRRACENLVRNRALGTIPPGRLNYKTMRVDYQRCKAFKKEFVSTTALGDIHEIPEERVQKILKRVGVECVQAPNGRQLFGWYDRKVAEKWIKSSVCKR